MRSYDKYRDTKYIQKSDIQKPALVTIEKITEEDVSGNGEMKYAIHFKENYKPWIANIGSLEEIAGIAGTGDVDRWPGTVIVIYVNPDVEYAGKRVGGIRCRAPKNKVPNEAPPEIQDEPEGEIPF